MESVWTTSLAAAVINTPLNSVSMLDLFAELAPAPPDRHQAVLSQRALLPLLPQPAPSPHMVLSPPVPVNQLAKLDHIHLTRGEHLLHLAGMAAGAAPHHQAMALLT